MKLTELKTEIRKYQYLEDDGMIDVCLASIVATRLMVGDPLWMILIGAPSSGKSQILRPLAMTDKKFIHSVDDLTENTFLSGAKSKGGGEMSLLNRIGPLGMIVISDMTGIFSKPSESRAAILSQLRMIYDGEMTKFSGTSSLPIKWEGHIGILAGSTPSIYAAFAEVATMGERFMYYRLKKFDGMKAGMVMMNRNESVKDFNKILAENYAEYLKEVVLHTISSGGGEKLELSEKVWDRIVAASLFAEDIRAVAEFDWKGENMVNIPVPAYPMRTAGQLSTLAKGLLAMKRFESGDVTAELEEKEMMLLDWCAYSLANEERRACLRVLASVEFGVSLTTSKIADVIGLSTSVTRNILQTLSSVKVVSRSGDSEGLSWTMAERKDYDFVVKMEGVGAVPVTITDRAVTHEEADEKEIAMNKEFETFGR